MLCWLLVVILLVARPDGRSEKAAPFWIRARWAEEWEPMKTEVRDPIRRVMMGPRIGRSSWRRRFSMSDREFRSQRRFPMIGMAGGPGGRFLEERWERRDLRRIARDREIRIRIQVSIF